MFLVIGSFESDFSSKENQTSPSFDNLLVNLSSSLIPFRPLHSNGALENSRIKTKKVISENGKDNDLRDEKIEEIEREISMKTKV
ncbi:hypothetical protein CQW23_14566 [Capsicum baccatum]|uniref:Uncharacterized protein n=1 Tax=Capsicum baccatum TaxID=33114 RepID=A0A2G2WJI7_CAPBA|nr:hypothetical protein CQW23_14566 [Capsicum baccatum]